MSGPGKDKKKDWLAINPAPENPDLSVPHPVLKWAKSSWLKALLLT